MELPCWLLESPRRPLDRRLALIEPQTAVVFAVGAVVDVPVGLVIAT
jgi:hypothetical protein